MEIWFGISIYHPDGKPSSLIFRYWDEGELPEREIIVEEIKHIFYMDLVER